MFVSVLQRKTCDDDDDGDDDDDVINVPIDIELHFLLEIVFDKQNNSVQNKMDNGTSREFCVVFCVDGRNDIKTIFLIMHGDCTFLVFKKRDEDNEGDLCEKGFVDVFNASDDVETDFDEVLDEHRAAAVVKCET